VSIEPVTYYQAGCDHCPPGMGDMVYWHDEDTQEPMLFSDAEEAHAYIVSTLVKEEGWTTDGDRYHCEPCSKLFPLIDPNPAPEPVPVLPGQIPLGGES
jgi:hypothetical protein